MAQVTRLLTFVEIADARGLSVSALHHAVLDDGQRVVLLADRGWTSSRTIAADSREDVERIARSVVGPDGAFGELSEADMNDLHWASLAQTLGEHGIVADAARLRELPHDVELSERFLALRERQSE